MRNGILFMLKLCFGLGVALLNAQNLVPNPELEKNRVPVLKAGLPVVAEANSAALLKYDKLPLAFERNSDSKFLALFDGLFLH